MRARRAAAGRAEAPAAGGPAGAPSARAGRPRARRAPSPALSSADAATKTTSRQLPARPPACRSRRGPYDTHFGRQYTAGARAPRKALVWKLGRNRRSPAPPPARRAHAAPARRAWPPRRPPSLGPRDRAPRRRRPCCRRRRAWGPFWNAAALPSGACCAGADFLHCVTAASNHATHARAHAHSCTRAQPPETGPKTLRKPQSHRL